MNQKLVILTQRTTLAGSGSSVDTPWAVNPDHVLYVWPVGDGAAFARVVLSDAERSSQVVVGSFVDTVDRLNGTRS